RRHTRFSRDWSSDVCSSDLVGVVARDRGVLVRLGVDALVLVLVVGGPALGDRPAVDQDRAALAGELRVAHALVVGAGVEVVGLRSEERRVGKGAGVGGWSGR